MNWVNRLNATQEVKYRKNGGEGYQVRREELIASEIVGEVEISLTRGRNNKPELKVDKKLTKRQNYTRKCVQHMWPRVEEITALLGRMWRAFLGETNSLLFRP